MDNTTKSRDRTVIPTQAELDIVRAVDPVALAARAGLAVGTVCRISTALPVMRASLRLAVDVARTLRREP